MIFLPNSILSGRHCLTLRFYTRLAEFSILIFPGSVAIMSLPTEKTNTDRYRSGYNGPDSKSGVPARVPWVRIPPCPPKAKGRPKGVLFLLAWHSQGGIRTGRRRSRSQQSGGLLASPRENPSFLFGEGFRGPEFEQGGGEAAKTCRWQVFSPRENPTLSAKKPSHIKALRPYGWAFFLLICHGLDAAVRVFLAGHGRESM